MNVDSKISVYIPLYNNEEWCRNFSPADGFDYVACDNASTDNSAHVMAAKGVTVIRHAVNLGRIGNWEFCVNHFVDNGKDWMKWLFAGDELYQTAATDLHTIIEDYPDARLIVSEFEIVETGSTTFWTMFDETRILEPGEALKKASLINWFGPPIATMFHKEALAKFNRFSELDWVSDMLFCLNIAAIYPCLYFKKVVGAFHTENRNYYQANKNSPISFIEESIAFNKALKMYTNLTGDEDFYQERQIQIVEELQSRLSLTHPQGIKKEIKKLKGYFKAG